MVTPLYGQILMRYPAREYEDVGPRSKPNALENSRNNLLDKVAVYTRKFKGPTVDFFAFQPVF